MGTTTTVDIMAKGRDVEQYYNRVAGDYNQRFYIEKGDYPPLVLRHNYMLAAIDKLNLPAGSRILDIGCGPGEMVADLAQRGFEVWGIDISDSMIRIAEEKIAARIPDRSRYHLSTGDIEKLDFKDGFFDAIICAGVVEYLPTDDLWPGELSRVLKKGGFLSINVTNRFAMRRWTMPITEGLKRSKPVFSGLDWFKRRVLRKGPLNQFPFRPRVHNPSAFDRFMAEKGFDKTGHNYFDFSIFPAPLDTVLSFVSVPMRKWLEKSSHRRMKISGTGYIVHALKR